MRENQQSNQWATMENEASIKEARVNGKDSLEV